MLTGFEKDEGSSSDASPHAPHVWATFAKQEELSVGNTS